MSAFPTEPPLSDAEAREWTEALKALDLHEASTIKYLETLHRIKHGRLYRKDFKTFEDFCRDRLGISHQRAYQLLNAASALEGLTPTAQPLVASERVARELRKVPPEKREDVLKSVSKKGKVTAKAIAQAGKESPKPAKPKPVEIDEVGAPVPESCLEFWNRRQEIQDMMTAISRVKTAVVRAREEKDPLYMHLAQAVIDYLSRTYGLIADEMPYAVCPNCQGHLKENCKACHGMGVLNKRYYEGESTRLKMK